MNQVVPFPPVGISGHGLQLVSSDAGSLWFPVIDEVMRCHISSSGTWEPDIGNAILSFMPRTGGVFVDVGANVGYFSCLVAGRCAGSVVHAFEPHPVTFQVLRLNSWRYRDQITAWPCALSDELTTISLETAEGNLGDTRGSLAGQVVNANVVAPAIMLDELLPELRADVIKIDVQGAELSVLRGMMGVVRNSAGVKVITEFGPAMLEEQFIDPLLVLDALRDLGFKLCLLRSGGPMEAHNVEIMDYCRSAGRYGQANLLLSVS